MDAGGGGGSSGPLSDYEIILIAVGGGVGCLILLTLVGLISWLMCCRRPPQGQASGLGLGLGLGLGPGPGAGAEAGCRSRMGGRGVGGRAWGAG